MMCSNATDCKELVKSWARIEKQDLSWDHLANRQLFYCRSAVTLDPLSKNADQDVQSTYIIPR